MSRNQRDDQGSSRERSAEQRERDRLEREARRARGQHTGEFAAPTAEPAPPRDLSDEPAPTPSQPPRARERVQVPDPPKPRLGRGRGRAASAEPPAAEPPAGRESATDRRSARRRTPPAEREQPPPVLRIKPDPPAPPAAPAGALGDETERPIGIRRAQRAVRTPRTIVTPPGDVPAGPARARRSVGARVGALIVLLLFAALLVIMLFLFQPFGSAEGDRVRVVIPAGSSAGEIGERLAAADVVGSGTLFSLRATLAGKRGELRSGRYTLNHGMTYGAAIEALSRKPAPVEKAATVNVTIPEGRSRKEIARTIGSKGLRGSYLKASQRFRGRLNPFRYDAPKGTRSLEGFLFPATYELKTGAPARDLVGKQLVAFRDNFDRVDLRRAKRRKLTGYDILIIASMVEREAQLPGERAKIAAVIYNRLKDGVPLGIDATIRYATDNWTRPLRQSELQIESAFNTRKRAGLPPTPIGNPGLASMRAAAAPANVDFRYYVVQPGTCGRHAFSSSFEQFQRDSQRYDQARADAGGKSPTTC